jgi:hypothetical protein
MQQVAVARSDPADPLQFVRKEVVNDEEMGAEYIGNAQGILTAIVVTIELRRDPQVLFR